jgi:DNA-binding transcriptional MerR regulator
LNRVLRAIIGFKGAYEGLKLQLEYNEQDEARLSAIQHLEQPLKECKAVLDHLQDRLKNVNFVGQYLVGSLWDRTIKKGLKRLEGAKELLDLAMHADQR